MPSTDCEKAERNPRDPTEKERSKVGGKVGKAQLKDHGRAPRAGARLRSLSRPFLAAVGSFLLQLLYLHFRNRPSLSLCSTRGLGTALLLPPRVAPVAQQTGPWTT